ncbi:subtilisin family serine protease [Krasilnikovia cinnamomea]|uniref:Subtilisin family serine protease n=1 Tax=Krasilnikovia cinnamomea TaxID=349313 RepID=A0A4Q7ZM26_9ACTN|nr:S8 family serine peptidase [Krasilnikovia cinnamomea]RZU52030.1 subtilisin family serine protease [Krasilnikovia cinnamomea]
MRAGVATLALGLAAGGLIVTGAPARADVGVPAVSLIVGLRTPDAGATAAGAAAIASTQADVVGRLDERVDVVDAAPLADAVTVEVPADQAAAATAALRGDPAVRYVEPDHVAHAAAVPNDPGYSYQWGVRKTRVSTAWSTTHGSSSVVIAVVDTGVSRTPDLTGRVLAGYDFVNNDSNAADDNGHGTLVAGVAAAAGNDAEGIAGVCWTCKVLPVKVLDRNGTGDYSDIAKGIRWAADHGADVINLSLSGTADSQLLRDAVTYAMGKGALVVAAAGNDGEKSRHFPAAISAVLSVGASTSADTRYSWSNYGGWVDVAAPGCNPAQAKDGSIVVFCGTSSSSPMVAGIAALLAGSGTPATPVKIRSVLSASARQLTTTWLTWGRVDAATALAALPDRTAPQVSFRTPAASALVGGTVSVGATATDSAAVSRVQLLLNDTVVASDVTAPYVLRWKSAPRNGKTTLVLRVYDRAGNAATARRTVLVDSSGPAVTVTKAPANRTRHIRGTKYVTAQASDAHGVARLELVVDGKVTQRYAVPTPAPGSVARHRFKVKTWKHGRSMTVRVRAYDSLGNLRSAPARKWYR